MSKGYLCHCDSIVTVARLSGSSALGQGMGNEVFHVRDISVPWQIIFDSIIGKADMDGYNLVDCLPQTCRQVWFGTVWLPRLGHQEFLFHDMQVLNSSIICIGQTIFMTTHNHLPSHIVYSCHTICLNFWI